MAAAAALANAVKAMGSIIRVEPGEFAKIVSKTKEPLIVSARGGFFSPNYQYLSSYKGLVFYTKSATELKMPADAEMVVASKIWIPS